MQKPGECYTEVIGRQPRNSFPLPDQHRDGRTVAPVGKFTDHNGVLFAVNGAQIRQQSVPFCEAGLPAVIDAKAHDPVLPQQLQSLSDGGDAGIRMGKNVVISTRQPTKIKGDAGNGSGLGICLLYTSDAADEL